MAVTGKEEKKGNTKVREDLGGEDPKSNSPPQFSLFRATHAPRQLCSPSFFFRACVFVKLSFGPCQENVTTLCPDPVEPLHCCANCMLWCPVTSTLAYVDPSSFIIILTTVLWSLEFCSAMPARECARTEDYSLSIRIAAFNTYQIIMIQQRWGGFAPARAGK